MTGTEETEMHKFISALFASVKPAGWTKKYLETSRTRMRARIDQQSKRVQQIKSGRTIPDVDDICLGSGTQLKLAVLFIDVCNFSGWPSGDWKQQEYVLYVFNVFMVEMMHVANDYGGEFEKNTGDGLMAYFRNSSSSQVDAVQKAVEVALVMHFLNDKFITPIFKEQGLWPIKFRVGIDFGPVTISRIGFRNTNSLVAIGTSANIACKLMKLIPDGGICIGNDVHKLLPSDWKIYCRKLSQRTGFAYEDQTKYLAWEFTHRLSAPDA